MARAKNNIAAKNDNQTLAYHFGTKEVGSDPNTAEVIRAPFVVFHPGYVDVSATEALSASAENKTPGAKDAATRFLRAMLSAGPVLKEEVEDAAEAEKIADRTLRRAKEALKVHASKSKGQWYWSLPDDGGGHE